MGKEGVNIMVVDMCQAFIYINVMRRKDRIQYTCMHKDSSP
jgi:hypothetical protein